MRKRLCIAAAVFGIFAALAAGLLVVHLRGREET